MRTSDIVPPGWGGQQDAKPLRDSTEGKSEEEQKIMEGRRKQDRLKQERRGEVRLQVKGPDSVRGHAAERGGYG